MLNIKYSPQRYENEIFYGLLDDFFDYDDKENKERYKEIPEFHLNKINDMEMEDESEEKINKKISKAYDKFPWHFEVKRDYYYSQKNLGNDLNFKEFFKEELACFESGTEYGRVVSDIEFINLVSFISNYYYENKEIDKLKKLYEEVEKTQHPEFYLELALLILGKSHLYYATIFDPSNDERSELWLEAEVDNEIYDDIYFDPRNSNFYTLLNTGLGYIDIKDIEQFDHLKNKEDIKNDILWLMKQGLTRAYLSDSNLQLDFISYALYLTASYEISDLYSYFIELFHNMTDNLRDLTYGDLPDKLILPAFLKIFEKLDESDFDFLRSDNEEAWYIKSNFLETLALICSQNAKDHYTHKLFKKLFSDWEKAGDIEMIGWLFTAIENRKIEGYENEIINAFDNKLIDIQIHGTKEYWEEKGKDPFVYEIAKLETFSQFVNHSQSSFLKDKEIDFEEKLENFIFPYRVPESDEDDQYLGDEDGVSEDDSFYFEEDEEDNIRPLWGLPYKRNEPKIGRNDVCPCGSGKKYKKCCGK
jgi:hypothetical protein